MWICTGNGSVDLNFIKNSFPKRGRNYLFCIKYHRQTHHHRHTFVRSIQHKRRCLRCESRQRWSRMHGRHSRARNPGSTRVQTQPCNNIKINVCFIIERYWEFLMALKACVPLYVKQIYNWAYIRECTFVHMYSMKRVHKILQWNT